MTERHNRGIPALSDAVFRPNETNGIRAKRGPYAGQITDHLIRDTGLNAPEGHDPHRQQK